MIIGAGVAGQTLIKELLNSNMLHSRICCMIDDNPEKKGKHLEGILIVGSRNGTIENCMDWSISMTQNEKIDEISRTINEDFERILELQDTDEEGVVESCR